MMFLRWFLIGLVILEIEVSGQTQPASAPEAVGIVPVSAPPATQTVPADVPQPDPAATAQSSSLPASQPVSQPTPDPSVPVEALPSTQAAPPPAPPVESAPATQPMAVTTSRPSRDIDDPRPDILLVVCENLPAGRLGVEGNTHVKTPHLDRLAKEGVLFTRAYTPTPQLAPAMASILTGQYAQTHGVVTDGVPLSSRADAFSARLKKAGYICGFVGQWPLDPAKAAMPGVGLTDYTATVAPNAMWTNADVWVNGQAGKADKFLSDWMTDRALEFLDRPIDGPFLLWVNFREFREPFVYPPGTESLYLPGAVEMPSSEELKLSQRPATATTASALQKYKALSEPQLREARSQYNAMLTHMDACIGRILSRLEEGSRWKNTMVVFTSDRGIAVGDRGLFGPALSVQELFARVPLLVRSPQHHAGGVRLDRVVSLVDLAPTFLQSAGLGVPIAVQGQSLLPLLADPRSESHADECFFTTSRDGAQIMALRGLVTRHFKLVTNVGGGGTGHGGSGELYDLKRDPQEKHNAYADVEYQAVLQVLQARLQKWRQATRDMR